MTMALEKHARKVYTKWRNICSRADMLTFLYKCFHCVTFPISRIIVKPKTWSTMHFDVNNVPAPLRFPSKLYISPVYDNKLQLSSKAFSITYSPRSSYINPYIQVHLSFHFDDLELQKREKT